MSDDNGLPGGIGLAEAIEALRMELTAAMITGTGQSIRFKPGPVELTVQAALTKSIGGNAGIKWWLIEAGADASRQTAVTQTLKISLQPAVLNSRGEWVDVQISGRDESPTGRPHRADSLTGAKE